MMFNKKKKKKKQYINKDDKLIKIGSRILTITTIFLCIILGAIKTFSQDEDSTIYLTADFTSLYEACDTREIITTPVDDDYRPAMLTKMSESGLDLNENDMPNYEKFSQDSIPLTTDISFTSQEVALLYSYVYMFNPDPYDVIIQQLSIANNDGVVSINTVSSIDFYTLFTKKVKGSYESEALTQLPKRIYVINTITFDNGSTIYSTAYYNNMDEKESNYVTTLINTATTDIDMSKYIPDLITNFLDELATKTNSTLSYLQDGVKFTLNETPVESD